MKKTYELTALVIVFFAGFIIQSGIAEPNYSAPQDTRHSPVSNYQTYLAYNDKPAAYPPTQYPPTHPSAVAPPHAPYGMIHNMAYPHGITPPSPVISTTTSYPARISHKSSTTAGILNLVGGFSIGGIGRLYGGSIAMGVGQLVLSILLPGVGQLWSLIDGAYILCGAATDSKCRHLTPHPEPKHTTIEQVVYPPY